MINIQSVIAPLALWLGLIAPPVAPSSEPPTVTVLCYHTFNSSRVSAYSLDSGRFDEQMRYLMVQHIPVIPLSDLVAHLREGKPVPDHSVVITIDDGYKSARTIAWPILQKYGFPFTLYVYPAAISHLRFAMTWQDLKYLSYMGVDIESHTQTHPLLTSPGKAMNPKDYEAWLDRELRDSRQTLEFELQKPVRHLAYPYGGYDDLVVSRARAAGYWSATTCDPMNATRHANPLLIPRRLIFAQTTTKAFVEGLRSRELNLTKRFPRDGETLPNLPAEIKTRVLNADHVLAGTLQMRIDHVRGGWHSAALDPVTGMVHFPMPRISHRGYFFLGLRAQDKDDPLVMRQASWLFLTRKTLPHKSPGRPLMRRAIPLHDKP